MGAGRDIGNHKWSSALRTRIRGEHILDTSDTAVGLNVASDGTIRMGRSCGFRC